jgi:hypothetical protein
MLDTSPANLWREYMAAKEYREEHLRSLRDRIARYVGPAYRGDVRRDEQYEPENHEFEYLSLVVPKIAYDNPRVRVVSQRQGSQRDVAVALQAGLNRWIREVNLRRVLSRVCVDMLLAWGCAMVTMEEDMEQELPEDVAAFRASLHRSQHPEDVGPIMRPKVHRISNQRVFWDPVALDVSEARYMGHEWIADKEDLLARARENPEEGWYYDVLSGLAENQGLDEVRRRGRSETSATASNIPSRGEVVCMDIFVRGHQIEGDPHTPSQGYNGAIFCLALSGDGNGAVEVRKARMAYCPPWGPYTFFGAYYVPDQTAPLAPTVAIHAQVRTLNLHARAVSAAAGRRKRVAFVSKSSPSLQRHVKAAIDGDVVPTDTEELNNNLKEVELGGLTPAAIQGLQLERERRDRIAGMSDAMRGSVTGGATATENAIADEAGSTRMAFLKQQFSDATTQLLKTVAWYLYKDDRIAFPLGDEAKQAGLPEGMDAGAPQDAWFFGGMENEGSGAAFRDLDLEIEAYSMERTSESVQMKRMMEVVQIISQVIPAAIQGPINLKDLMNMLGDMTNIPELGKVVNLQAAQLLQTMMLQGAIQQQMQPSPALAGDSGLGKGVSPPGGSPPMHNGLRGVTPAPKSPGGNIGQRAGNSARSRVTSHNES